MLRLLQEEQDQCLQQLSKDRREDVSPELLAPGMTSACPDPPGWGGASSGPGWDVGDWVGFVHLVNWGWGTGEQSTETSIHFSFLRYVGAASAFLASASREGSGGNHFVRLFASCPHGHLHYQVDE